MQDFFFPLSIPFEELLGSEAILEHSGDSFLHTLALAAAQGSSPVVRWILASHSPDPHKALPGDFGSVFDVLMRCDTGTETPPQNEDDENDEDEDDEDDEEGQEEEQGDAKAAAEHAASDKARGAAQKRCQDYGDVLEALAEVGATPTSKWQPMREPNAPQEALWDRLRVAENREQKLELAEAFLAALRLAETPHPTPHIPHPTPPDGSGWSNKERTTCGASRRPKAGPRNGSNLPQGSRGS